MKNIIIFMILQLLNVMLSTLKSIVQIKGTKLAATLTNSIFYAFYTVVVIFMVADFVEDARWNLVIKVGITFIANLIGTWLSMSLIERYRKDKLWKIEVTVYTQYAKEIDDKLENIPHSYIQITSKHTVFTFYCSKKEESQQVKEIVDKYDGKYFVSENHIIL